MDPQNSGLGELGQRLQAMSDPVQEPRPRTFQGAPLPIGPASNGGSSSGLSGSPSSSSFSSYGPLEDIRISPPPAPPIPSAASQMATSFANQYAAASRPAYSATPVQTGVGDVPAPVFQQQAAAGSKTPESVGSGDGSAGAPPVGQFPQAAPQPAPTPLLTEGLDSPKSGIQRAVAAVRSALPLVQRLLPLLDGNFATVLSALVASPLSHPTPPAPQVRVDLDPLERGLAEVRNSHRELRGQVSEQVTTLKRVEDQLERVREATDRNTLEQQELIEDLRAVGSRVSTFAVVGLVLLAVSIGLNVYFLVQLQHILR